MQCPLCVPYHVESLQGPLPSLRTLGLFAHSLLRVMIPTAALVVTLLVPKARNFHRIRPTDAIWIGVHHKMNAELRAALVWKHQLFSFGTALCLAELWNKVFPKETGNLLAGSQMKNEWPMTSLQVKEEEHVPRRDGVHDGAVFCSAAILL